MRCLSSVNQRLAALLTGLALLLTAAVAQAAQTGQEIAEQVAGISNRAIFNLEVDPLRETLRAYLADRPEIGALRVIDAVDGEVLIRFHRDGGNAIFGAPVPDPYFSLATYTADAIFQDEKIGIIEVYIQPVTAVELSLEERTWITHNPTIRVDGDIGWPPFNFQENGVVKGLSIDYMNLLARKVGLDVEYVVGPKWHEFLEMMQDGRLDVMLDIVRTPEREEYLFYTPPYAKNPNTILSKTDANLQSVEDLFGKTVAVPKGFFYEEILRNEYPQVTVLPVEGTLESMKAVSFGDADAAFGELAVFNYYLTENLMTGLAISGEVTLGDPEYANVNIAVPKNLAILGSILTKGMTAITPEEERTIRERWLGQVRAQPAFALPDVEQTDASAAVLNYLGVILAAAFLIIFVAWFMRGRPSRLSIRETVFLVSFLFACLIVSTAVFLTLLIDGATEQSEIEERKYASLNLALELKQSSDELTRFARTYVQTGNPRYKEYFEAIIAIRDGIQPHPKNFTRSYWDQVIAGAIPLDAGGETYSIEGKTVELGFSEQERAKIALAKQESDDLINLEVTAFNALEGLFKDADGKFTVRGVPDPELAQALLYGPEYHEAKSRIMKPLDDFFALLEWRTANELEEVRLRNKAVIGTITGLAIATIAFAIFVFFLLNRKVIAPLGSLREGAVAISQGNYTHETGVRSKDEIGDLAIAFDTMARGILERTDKIQHQRSQLLSILENSRFGVSIVSTATNERLYINSAMLDLFGVKNKEVFAQIPLHTTYVNPEDLERMRTGRADNFVREAVVERYRADGTRWWCMTTRQTIDYEGEEALMVWHYDVTERQQAEDRLKDAYSIISESVTYAANIQQALLTGRDVMSATLDDHMIIWEPRDNVGGDFYWCRVWGNGILIILADCTGHGVPGAFMTLIASGALDRSMGEVPAGNVAALLTRMHQVIQHSLSQHGDVGASDDGLDLGACYFDEDITTLKFAGARFPLFIVQNGEVTEIKGDKSGIGYRGIPQTQLFQEHLITIEAGQTFFMTSDGFLDQVGGERRRMFGKRRFKALLTELAGEPLDDQRQALMEALEDYQGEETRRDDVSMIAFQPVSAKA